MADKPGLAAQTIDFYYGQKLPICEGWDRFFGLRESNPFSAIFVLEACYISRRPQFQALDYGIATAVEIQMRFFELVFSTKGRRAITQVSVSPFGEHRVIVADFGR